MNFVISKDIDKIKKMTASEIAKKYKCKENEVCMGDYIAKDTIDTVCPYVVILGCADFEGSRIQDLGKLRVVFGEKRDYTDMKNMPIYRGVNFAYSKIKSTKNLEKVYGTINFSHSDITSLGNMKELYSGLFLNHTKIIDLGKLNKIHGVLSLDYSILESLGELEEVEEIWTKHCQLKDFGALKRFKSIDIEPVSKYEEPLKICKQRLKEIDKNISITNDKITLNIDKENDDFNKEMIVHYQNQRQEQNKKKQELEGIITIIKNLKLMKRKFISTEDGYMSTQDLSI